MDTMELLHSFSVLAPSRPTTSGVTPRPPFYSRTCDLSRSSANVPRSTSSRSTVGSRGRAGIDSSGSSRRKVPEHHVLEDIGSMRANRDEEHYEQEWRNRDALLRAREESLRLREEMVLLKKSHAREMLLQSNRRKTRTVGKL